MQALEMHAFRSFRICKTVQTLFSRYPNPTIACCSRCRTYGRFPKKFHSTPHRLFSSSTADNESTASSWSVFPNLLPPADLPSQQSERVQAAYDPTTDGSKETDTVVDKAGKNQPSIEVGSRARGDFIGSSSVSSSIRRKEGKSKTVYVCESCGYSDGQWWGNCRECEQVGTMKRFTTETVDQKVSGTRLSENVSRAWLLKGVGGPTPIKLTDVCGRIDELNWRIPLNGIFGAEVERVLGGGLVPGSLVLVGGDPGVGKSTLLLQIAALIAEGNGADASGRVIYVSGEESVEQIGNRADRLRIETEELFLYSSTDIEDILEQAEHLSPKALVIDSIQTVYLKGVAGSAGGLVQVKECTSSLLRFAKKTNIPVLLIGHVTKTGDIAGPRVLEHIVDAVLYMEGEKCSSHRLLRPIKNRFGSTDELGVLKMSQSGLEGVSNPSEMFLSEQQSDSDYLAGLAVAVIMDGSRAFLIEIQALCAAGSSFTRQVNGVEGSRAGMLISVIIKQAGLKLQDNDIFLNVVSGVSMTERAGDLAIVAAICSSFLEFPIPVGIAFIAEVGLGGELRMVPQLEKRVNTLAKLGYKKCIVSKSAEKALSHLQPGDMEIVGCKNLKEMINVVFSRG